MKCIYKIKNAPFYHIALMLKFPILKIQAKLITYSFFWKEVDVVYGWSFIKADFFYLK